MDKKRVCKTAALLCGLALCGAAVILRRFLCQGSEWLCCRVSSGTEKGERESVPPPLRFIPLP